MGIEDTRVNVISLLVRDTNRRKVSKSVEEGWKRNTVAHYRIKIFSFVSYNFFFLLPTCLLKTNSVCVCCF